MPGLPVHHQLPEFTQTAKSLGMRLRNSEVKLLRKNIPAQGEHEARGHDQFKMMEMVDAGKIS